jgi:hypothetical protein
LFLLLGCLLRITASLGPLWLDEVWNIRAVEHLGSPLDVYFKNGGLDGHSSLFSCILYFFKPHLPDFVYRLPNLLFAIATLIVTYFYNPLEKKQRTIFVALLSFSYLFTLYGIEARGYSGMIFCMALCYSCFLRFTQNIQDKLAQVLFVIASCLGFLFHYSFVMWFLALEISYVAGLLISNGKRLHSLTIFSTFTIPSVFIAFMYLAVLRYLPPGNGPHYSFIDSFTNLLSVSLGGLPISSSTAQLLPITLCFALLFLWIVTREVTILLKENINLSILYFTSIVVVPVLLTIILKPEVILPRYYLGSAFMFLSLLASYVSRPFKRTGICVDKITKISALALFTLGNIYLNYSLLKLQHGNYSIVINEILKSSTSEKSKPVSIITDHTFRHQIILDYYAPNTFRLVKDSLQSESNWYLSHSLDWNFQPPSRLSLPDDSVFLLVKTVKSTHLSGWGLALYSRSGLKSEKK